VAICESYCLFDANDRYVALSLPIRNTSGRGNNVNPVALCIEVRDVIGRGLALAALGLAVS
jgi:hypothetical protein